MNHQDAGKQRNREGDQSEFILYSCCFTLVVVDALSIVRYTPKLPRPPFTISFESFQMLMQKSGT